MTTTRPTMKPIRNKLAAAAAAGALLTTAALASSRRRQRLGHPRPGERRRTPRGAAP